MPEVMRYGVRPSIGRRVNWRMITIVTVFGLLVGYPVYTFVKAQVTGGIEKVAGGYHVDLKALGNFPFNDQTGTVADIPKQFRDLDGKQVTLEGFVYNPNAASDRVNQFQFVYNIAKCCFGGPPQVQERVFAVVPGEGIYDPGMYTMVQLSGVLQVQVVKDDAGKASSVYTLKVNGAKPVS